MTAASPTVPTTNDVPTASSSATEPTTEPATSAPDAASDTLSGAQAAYDAFVAQGLALNLQRGQPSTADFELSNDLLQIVGPQDVTSADGLDVRNYSVGAQGLSEARALFGDYLDVDASQVLVWNNASLELQGHVFTRMLLKGARGGTPWVGTQPTIIVTTPGYDRHFTLLAELGVRLVTVDMQSDGPDIDAIEALVARDPSVRGILFVPTYSNPGGETISPAKAERLAGIAAGAADFTIFADDAYRAHHLFGDDRDQAVNFIELVSTAGRADAAFVFASTSKITFAGAGLGFVASSPDNITDLASYLGKLSIGANKIEQLRHVRFLTGYPGGIDALMSAHAAVIAPKFAAVDEVLRSELGGSGLATWTSPKGGYFISLDTALPVADRVVAMAKDAGVSLTPAGAAFPGGDDPNNSHIRLAPTRPELDDVVLAMRVVATCIKLASAQYRQD